MKPGTYVLKNVPNDQLAEVLATFPDKASISTVPEPDGEWTVIVVIPDSTVSAAAAKTATKIRKVE